MGINHGLYTFFIFFAIVSFIWVKLDEKTFKTACSRKETVELFLATLLCYLCWLANSWFSLKTL